MLSFVILTLVLAVHGAPRSPFDGRIVGGRSATIEQYPYQASVHVYGYFTCGGSIISPTFVVTAAHCTDGQSAAALGVRVASNSSDSDGQEIPVKKFYQNPLFSMDTMDYDISILHLYYSIQLGTAAMPIPLAPVDFKIPSGAKVTVTGWGVTSEYGEISNDLQVVQIPAISNEECEQAYHNLAPITDRMVCAREEEGGKDSCQGDSGGPLVVNGLLTGIVSWGFGCAEPQFPGVYSRVSELRDFIKNVTSL